MRVLPFLLFFLSASAYASPIYQAPSFTTPREFKLTEKKELGWKPAASISALYSFSSSENVIGQTDGVGLVYGLNFKGTYTRIEEHSEWRNTLSYAGTTTKTPALPRYVKSSDELKLETIYLKSLPDKPALGPYVRGEITTSAFRGEDVRNGPTTYLILNSDGTERGTQQDATLRLTDAFRPFAIKESVGFFWKPENDEKMTLELRSGLGAMHVFAKDQLAVQDNSSTSAIEIVELKSFTQTGIEFGVLFKGKIDEKLNYELAAESLTPLIKERGETRNAFRLTNYNLTARISSQITSWASISYDFKLKMQPQLIEKSQVQQMLVLNINYNLL